MNVTELNLPGQQEHFGRSFPRVLESPDGDLSLDEFLEWLSEHRQDLRASLTDVGAILFRGFPVKTDRDFDVFVEAMGCPNFRYRDSLSNAVRVNRTERVFTANEAPPEVTIYLHHEMAQTPIFPSSLFFYCEQSAERGGATPICRSDVLLSRLREVLPHFVADCEAKGLKYSNVMPGDDDLASGMGRSWRGTLSCDSKSEAEERLGALGYDWQWEAGDTLRVTTPRLPALRRLASGRESFFNQLIAAFKGWKDERNDPAKAITFGDGKTLNRQDVLQAAEIAEALTFDIPGMTGDVAWVDNFSTMHGRRSFSGTRRVLASLVACET